ncbi:MAG: Wzz/FepE/Etk N-terminal domain-containing protein, partial [Acidiferrobacterales bacterium]
METCWKRKWIILAFAIVLPLITVIVSLKMTKVYEATAKVKILDFEDTQALLQRQIPESWGRLDHVSGIATISQAEVIRSRTVIEPVTEKLDLRRRVTIIDKLMKAIGLIDEYRDERIRLEKLVEPGFIGAFLQRRQIYIEPMEDADIIEIYAYSDILEDARDMANEVALSYVEQAGKLKKQKAHEALEIIEHNLVGAKEKLEKSQDDLRDFMASHYVVDLDKRIIDMQNNLNDFENRYFLLNNDLMVR